jgi:hypothetical protein
MKQIIILVFGSFLTFSAFAIDLAPIKSIHCIEDAVPVTTGQMDQE